MIERVIANLLANLLNKYSSRSKGGKKITLIESFTEGGMETNEEGFLCHLITGKVLKITVSTVNTYAK